MHTHRSGEIGGLYWTYPPEKRWRAYPQKPLPPSGHNPHWVCPLYKAGPTSTTCRSGRTIFQTQKGQSLNIRRKFYRISLLQRHTLCYTMTPVHQSGKLHTWWITAASAHYPSHPSSLALCNKYNVRYICIIHQDIKQIFAKYGAGLSVLVGQSWYKKYEMLLC